MKNLTLKEQGKEYNALKDLLSDIDNSTELLNINTAAMGIYSPIKPSVKGNSTYVFSRVTGNHKEDIIKGTLSVPKYSGLIETAGDSIIKIGTQTMAASTKCMASIYTKLGVTGDSLQLYGFSGQADDEFLTKKTAYILRRDNFIKALMEEGVEGKLLYRKNDDGDMRAMHMFSPKGEHIKQSTIIELIDYISSQMGSNPEINYMVEDDLTCVWVKYPGNAEDFSDDKGVAQKIVPGVYIETSDTGECALTIRGVESIKGVYVYSGVVRRVHKGKFDIEDFKKNFDKYIFPEYLKFPQRMVVLAGIDIDDIDAYIDALYEQSPLGQVLGRQKKEIKDALLSALNAKTTALSVILELMNLRNKVKVVTKEKETKLAEAITAAMFTDVKIKAILLNP